MGNLSPQFNTSPRLHVRVQGTSRDVPLAELNLEPQAGEHQIRHAVGAWLGLSSAEVNRLQLDRSPNGNLILRPAAVFG